MIVEPNRDSYLQILSALQPWYDSITAHHHESETISTPKVTVRALLQVLKIRQHRTGNTEAYCSRFCRVDTQKCLVRLCILTVVIVASIASTALITTRARIASAQLLQNKSY